MIAFDRADGYLTAEAGVTLDEILQLIVPHGFFLPVTPGTKFVTLGGAIANDVHGKNHHVDGTFCHHVEEFELLRSDGRRLICSRHKNSDYFFATIGGLGLTGLVTWVKFKLKPVAGALVAQEIIKTSGLRDFFDLSRSSDKDYLYTVSWIDCLAPSQELGRGLFIRGNHSDSSFTSRSVHPPTQKSLPVDLPGFVLNRYTVNAFNTFYYHRQISRKTSSVVHYDPFFYPLDALHQWNRVYGKQGFLQWQCVLPFATGGEAAIREILQEISRSGQGSFLAVLKTFGDKQSLGMMSFPREGITLALDFPHKGEPLFKLLNRLDDITQRCHGSIYTAKDARMTPEHFAAFYPRWAEFSKFIDPAFSSSLWRRVTTRSSNS
jgi:FAD/FMN-containing dehydrogenase